MSKQFFMSVENVQTQTGEEYANDMNNTVIIIGNGRETKAGNPCIAFECVHTGQRFRVSVSSFVKAVQATGVSQDFFYIDESDEGDAWHYDPTVEFHMQVKDWKITLDKPREKPQPKAKAKAKAKAEA